MIRIVVVEDSNAVRRGLIRLLDKHKEIEVVGEAEDGLKAMELFNHGLETDIVLADLNMPEMGGIELIEELRVLYPTIKVVILTMHTRTEFVDKALAAGAKGYLLKDGDFDDIYSGLKKVYKGEVHISINLE